MEFESYHLWSLSVVSQLCISCWLVFTGGVTDRVVNSPSDGGDKGEEGGEAGEGGTGGTGGAVGSEGGREGGAGAAGWAEGAEGGRGGGVDWGRNSRICSQL